MFAFNFTFFYYHSWFDGFIDKNNCIIGLSRIYDYQNPDYIKNMGKDVLKHKDRYRLTITGYNPNTDIFLTYDFRPDMDEAHAFSQSIIEKSGFLPFLFADELAFDSVRRYDTTCTGCNTYTIHTPLIPLFSNISEEISNPEKAIIERTIHSSSNIKHKPSL